MIKNNIEKIIRDIEEIKGQAYEDAGVTIVAASKMQDEDKISQAIDAGIRDLGENKVQEFKSKYDTFKDRANFHLIGSLQSNKVKDILGRVKLVHSLDRESLLHSIEKRAKKEGLVQDVLVQVNVAKETTKSGVYVEDLKDLLDKVEACQCVRVRGLMTMAPHYEDPEDTRWVFAEMKKIFDDIATIPYNNTNMEYLSMGMSHDYKIALECGSNMIRIGSDIFGTRNY